MSFQNQKNEIVKICKDLLANATVDTVLCYTDSEVGGSSAYFARSADEIDGMKWDEHCLQNLTAYLRGRKDKTAIVAKACDARGICSLLVENQLDRDKIYIIGVDCAGMKNADGTPAPGCGECNVHVPPIFDAHVEGAEPPAETAKGDKDYSAQRFKAEIDKCILCYSCRQACYGCYCEVCFMDRGGQPDFHPAEPEFGTKMTYHLGRAMHLAGRCVECGACQRVCASGVDIRYLIQSVTGFVDDTYDYRAGMDLETRPAMAAFTTTDKEAGFLGGDGVE